MIRIGCDSGVVIATSSSELKISELPERFSQDGDVLLVFSAISVFEVLAHAFRRGRAEEGRDVVRLLHELDWVQRAPVYAATAERAAGYRHGLGLHSTDALILACRVEAKCEAMITRDRDFEIADRQGIIKVEFL